MLKKLFSPSGRVNRLQNLRYELLVFVSMFVVAAALSFVVFSTMYLFGIYDKSMIQPSGSELSIIFLLLTLVAMYSNIIIKIKRLHDMNLSGWWLTIFLLLAIPYIALYFWPGTKGKNRFDEDNNKTIDNSNPSLAKAVINHTTDTDCNIKPIKCSDNNCKDDNQEESNISIPKEIDEDKKYIKKEVNLTEENTCSKCLTINTSSDLFCKECGNKLGENSENKVDELLKWHKLYDVDALTDKTIEEFTCSKCLTINNQSDLFCKECGNKLGKNLENKVDELLKWHKLYDVGALTEEEFNKKKKELI